MEQTIRDLISRHLLDDSGRKVLKKTLDGDSLIDAGLLDSLGMVQLVEHLEREFKVAFDAMDISIENLESVNKIAELIKSKQ